MVSVMETQYIAFEMRAEYLAYIVYINFGLQTVEVVFPKTLW